MIKIKIKKSKSNKFNYSLQELYLKIGFCIFDSSYFFFVAPMVLIGFSTILMIHSYF